MLRLLYQSAFAIKTKSQKILKLRIANNPTCEQS